MESISLEMKIKGTKTSCIMLQCRGNTSAIIVRGTKTNPYVVIYDWNVKDNVIEWSQGHYFDDLGDAFNYFINDGYINIDDIPFN